MPAIRTLIDPANPLTWLLASLAIAVLGSNGSWFLLGRRGRHALARSQAGALAALTWLAAALFLLVPPLLAWERGVLSPYALGVTEQQWLVTLSVGLPAAAIIVSLFLFGWLVYRRSLTNSAESSVAVQSDAAVQSGAVHRAVQAVKAPLDAALCQWHWAFYRGLMIGWLAAVSLPAIHISALSALFGNLQAQPLYWGSWLGLAWAGLEWALNPFSRAALRDDGTREAALRGIALALATTALFTLTRNLWLCMACHIVIETAIAVFFPLPALQPAAE